MKRVLLAGGLIVAGLLLAADARAQGSGTARGKVMDDKNQPVEGADIALEYQGGVTRKHTTKSNKKGEFTQVGLQPGVYRVTATKEGFQGGYIDVRIALGEATYLPDLKLVSAAAARAAGAGGVDTQKATDELRQMVKEAQALAAADKYDEAIAAFQAVLAKGVASPEEVHFRIGQLHAEKKDWAAAEASFQKALEIKPDHSGVTLELANVYQLSGQTAKASELMAKAQGAGEGNANVQYSTGVLHLNAGRQDEAAAAFKKAVAIDPAHAESYFHLATIGLNQNNMPDAIANLEKYLSLNPTNTQNVATAQALLKALKPAK
jgi:tetratricopeptide (TPR) repeat protein